MASLNIGFIHVLITSKLLTVFFSFVIHIFNQDKLLFFKCPTHKKEDINVLNDLTTVIY